MWLLEQWRIMLAKHFSELPICQCSFQRLLEIGILFHIIFFCHLNVHELMKEQFFIDSLFCMNFLFAWRKTFCNKWKKVLKDNTKSQESLVKPRLAQSNASPI